MQLSKRLNAINKLVTEPYDIIWDCCCDHGLLGQALLERRIAQQVNFVDIVPELMQSLEKSLQQVAQAQCLPSWQVRCEDVAQIKLPSGAKQVVIIAGVGGDLCLKFISQIIANNPHCLSQLSFILCPVHHLYKVRSGLKELGLHSVNEQIVVENKRFYEVLHVSFQGQGGLSRTGTKMWDKHNPQHHQYQQQLLRHYTRMLNQSRHYYQKVITDYQQVFEHER
jgi:tRNA (adenine22-N1)-methyltransferase